jgi:ComF family protein
LELKQQILSFTQKAGSNAFGLLFPNICLSCSNQVTKQGVLCPDCWSKLHFVEKPYCEVLGTPFGLDFGPGMVSAQAIAHPPSFARARSATIHVTIARQLVSRLKYGDRTDLAPWMGDWMIRAGGELIAETDVIVPIPLHAGRYFSRRYNQAAELGRSIAQKTEIPFLPEAMLRKKATKNQVGLTRTQRLENVRGAFMVPPASEILISGKTVLLIDDVFTTGATANVASAALLKAGAAKVNLLTFSHAIPGFVETQSPNT